MVGMLLNKVVGCILTTGIAASMGSLLLVGCASSEQATENSASLSSDASSTDTPIVDELVYGQETPDSHLAREAVVLDCMERAGMTYSPEPFFGLSSQIEETTNSREWRERNGYGVTLGVDVVQTVHDTTQGATVNDRYVSQLSPVEFDLWQSAFDECATEGDAAIAEQAREFGEEISRQDRASLESIATYSEPRLAEAVTGWATCMQQRGHDFSDPFAAQQSIIDAYQEIVGAQDPSTADQGSLEDLLFTERTLAVDDLDCSEEPTRVMDALARELETKLAAYGPRTDWGQN